MLDFKGRGAIQAFNCEPKSINFVANIDFLVNCSWQQFK